MRPTEGRSAPPPNPPLSRRGGGLGWGGKRLASALLALLFLFPQAASANTCKGTLYLTLDTGSMIAADHIADVMKRRDVKATFFLANERTYRDDYSLDDSWGPYWRERVAEGHRFGSHTWRHWYFRSDRPDGTIVYSSYSQREREMLDAAGVCTELTRVDEQFRKMTGRALDPIWRAPGGRTTPNSLKYAEACGFREHVGWSPAGFLGDELSSETHPNAALLARALKNIRNGDILMMHLGIWSRQERFADVFEPLITGLQERGFCFATLPIKPARAS